MIAKDSGMASHSLISSPNRLASAASYTHPTPELKINLPVTWRLANTMYYGDRGHFDCAAMWDGPIA